MFTFTNGIILRGLNLEPVKANVTVDDGIIIDISKDTKEGKVIDVDGSIIAPSFLNGHTQNQELLISSTTGKEVLRVLNF